MSMISAVQSHDYEGSPMSKEEKLRCKSPRFTMMTQLRQHMWDSSSLLDTVPPTPTNSHSLP